MDKYNRFHTPVTYSLIRLDWAVLMFAGIALLIVHWKEIHWWRFVWAFLLPDLIGTAPGMYLYYGRRSGAHRSIPPLVHQLYNFAHSFVTITAFCAIWYAVTGRLEWAMLAFPIHLTGDRCIFGNIYKPFGLAFEPVPHESFRRFEQEYQAAGVW